MTKTYDVNVSTDKDKVRLLIGDVNESTMLLADEEIAYFLSFSGTSVTQAAIKAVEASIARLGEAIDKTLDGFSARYSQRFDHLQTVANRLRDKLAYSTALPYAGGISVADKDSAVEDSDRVQPQFAIEEDTVPGRDGSAT